MALSKQITRNNGITTSYHKVTSVTVSQDASDLYHNMDEEIPILLNVKLTSYLNEEYRQNNAPIESQMFYFNLTPEEEESTSARKLAYNKIKSLDTWADAIDC